MEERGDCCNGQHAAAHLPSGLWLCSTLATQCSKGDVPCFPLPPICRQERQGQQPAGAAALPPALPGAVQAGQQHCQMQAAQQSVQLLPPVQPAPQQQPPASSAAVSQPFTAHLPAQVHLANCGSNSSSTTPSSAAKRKVAALGADLDSQAAGKRPALTCVQSLQPFS